MSVSTALWRTGARAAAPWFVLAVLGGCGAGVVGTGTGTGNDGDIEYAPVGLCTAPFAGASLQCSGIVIDPDRGTAAVQWADGDKATGAAVRAVAEGNGITLSLPCRQLVFTGRWGELRDGTQAFAGRYTAPEWPEGRAAYATVQAQPNEPDAVGSLALFDAAGAPLFGPWLVRRIEGEVSFTACGP